MVRGCIRERPFCRAFRKGENIARHYTLSIDGAAGRLPEIVISCIALLSNNRRSNERSIG